MPSAARKGGRPYVRDAAKAVTVLNAVWAKAAAEVHAAEAASAEAHVVASAEAEGSKTEKNEESGKLSTTKRCIITHRTLKQNI